MPDTTKPAAATPIDEKDLSQVSGGSLLQVTVPNIDVLIGTNPADRPADSYFILNPASFSLGSVPFSVFIQAGDEDDSIELTANNDTIFANLGNDFVDGGDGDDVLIGDGVNSGIVFRHDQVGHNGAPGQDKLYGGDGADTLYGDTETQSHIGGDDTLMGGHQDHAADLAFGGGGNDDYHWRPGDGNDTFHGGEGRDTLLLLSMWQYSITNFTSPQGASLVHRGGDEWGMVDGNGNPITFSGSLMVGTETLTFTDIETIIIMR
ncbi:MULTISPECIES: hypothetical protein [Roseomonadaceae]|uniref:Calcium-binding protein n=1 Tax=Falsiroseomonas oleicola TaxID=2801474 RepID=A0ABS6H9S7_9PROT|nr:hypothetical protein [Roseomonas oleicola]MBU8545467.1 hypothetical protein [Roseomonas oleicola]